MKKDEFWAKGSFTQSMSKAKMKEKEKTIHKKHDEDMNFNCKECNKKISVHNKDWHDEMCDDCFNCRYFPDDPPEKDPFSEANSRGKCRLCNKEFSGKNIKKHILKDIKNNKGTTESFLLKAHAGPFWVYLSVPASKKLINIDRFLRNMWLECCGHLSTFTISGQKYYSHDIDLEIGDKTMEVKLQSILAPGLKFNYEYDFGTPTELNIECISRIKTNENQIIILARNKLPEFRCEICNAEAEQVCVQCIWGGGGFVCKKCSKKHKCEEPSFLPIVNSPRFGMCGFTGEEYNLLNK